MAVAEPIGVSGPGVASDAPWWKTGVVYHVYPRSFLDADGDGVGDLRGIIDGLDYLNDGSEQSLGVAAIWLSPIYPSPWRDGGYDVADHTAIDPRFGDLEEFDELIREAHRRGIRVLMDLVLNHTSDLHPWFIESRSNRDNPRRSWYVWRDPRRGGGPPNNWRSFFGGRAWTWDEETGQYYLHTFRREQPDLNWHNPDVRNAALEITRFWLDRGVDGFRFDVFNVYFKHPDLPSNPRRLGKTAWSRQHHVYNKDRPELRAFLAELRALLDGYPGAISVGETFDGDPELAASYCDTLHLAFNFRFLEQPWRAAAIQAEVARWDRLLADEHLWPCYVLSNHDRPRHAWRFGGGLPVAEADARAKVAAMLLLTLRGTAFVYYGEEIGMHNVDVSTLEQWDEYCEEGGTRDRARTPMQWSGASNAGFSSATPWLPVAPDYQERNVHRQHGDPRSILTFYRQLIRLRNASPALQLGSWTSLVPRPENGLAYLRETDDQTMVIALNLSGQPTMLKLARPLPGRWIPRLSTRRPDTGWAVSLPRELTLAPYEATVFEQVGSGP